MRGNVVFLTAFDVASETVTQNVRELLALRPPRSGKTVDHTTPKAVPFYQPLEIDSGLSATCRGKPGRRGLSRYDVRVVTEKLGGIHNENILFNSSTLRLEVEYTPASYNCVKI